MNQSTTYYNRPSQKRKRQLSNVPENVSNSFYGDTMPTVCDEHTSTEPVRKLQSKPSFPKAHEPMPLKPP